MRIFLILLLLVGVFVAALLVGGAAVSDRCRRLTRRWHPLFWVAALAIPALAIQLGSARYVRLLASVPEDVSDLREAELTLLHWLAAAYGVGFAIGGWPRSIFFRRSVAEEPSSEEKTK